MALPKAYAQGGSTAYNFLDVTSSARIYGLGGINISTVDDNLNVTDQNPALLGPEMSNQILVDYMHYVGSSNFAGARYAHSVNDHGAWSAGIRYFGYGAITAADETGTILGKFSPKDIAFNGAFSYDIYGYWRGGINVKLLYSSYEQYSAMALATDIGFNYYDADRDLSLSIVGANLGGQIKKFNNETDRLPIDLRLGWSQSFGSFPVRFSVTAWNLTHWHLPYKVISDNSENGGNEEVYKDSFSSNLFRHLVFGAELISSEKFYVSLGYNYRTRTDMSTYSRSFLSGFSLGAGLNTQKFRVGLAIAQPHTGATTFMLNLTLDLNDFLN
ncbi:MAG: type IX secretion system protein PorQ [Muribaculaceae bacterium]|nr:type IX secretion system protein PorQ [Muribaculaceae bacterium]